MPIYLNNNKVKDLYVGNTKIGWSFLNGKLVYTNQIKTFNAGSNLVQYKVPNGVNKLRIDCVASKGYQHSSSALGGNGGRVQCDLNVSGGQILYITVGSIPNSGVNATYNASDIRVGGTDLSNRIIVAGGGGSSGSGGNGGIFSGGAGGGLTGANGYHNGGYNDSASTGGTQSSGGNGGSIGSWFGNAGGTGTLGLGGNGGATVSYGGTGGAGGAGYYGGGGGSSPGRAHWNSSAGNGGAGGSSYTNDNCSNVVHTQGYMNGNGYIKITPIN